MRSRFFKFFAACAILALASAPRLAHADEAKVGYTTLTVAGATAERGDPSNRLRVVVWYPATPDTIVHPIDVGPPDVPFFSEGDGARDAQIAPTAAKQPFIVVSHGTGGTNMDLTWLCAGLVAHGYIVASVDHPGNNALDKPTVAGSSLWWQRANDLSRTIDGVLAVPRFAALIDASRIGAAGFSLGGYSVLVLGGARGDVRRIQAYCARNPASPVCTEVGTPGFPDIAAQARKLAAADPLFREAIAENATSHKDVRVRAILAIAPALGPALIPQSLHDITVPVAFIAGFGDPVLPVDDNVIPDALAIPDAELTILPKPAGHYTFLTDCAQAGRERFHAICDDAGPSRQALHERALSLARSFFERALGR